MELAASTTDAAEICGSNFNMCTLLYNITGNDDVATTMGSILDFIFRILLIVIGAYIARAILIRITTKVIEKTIGRNRGLGLDELGNLIANNPKARRAEMVGDRSRERSATLISIFQYVISIAVFLIAFAMCLDAVGVSVAPLLASAGVLGLAVGFGAQNLVKDYVSGIFMLMEDQYGVGDFVDVGDVAGTVEDMGLRVTTIRDLTGTLWYVRNGEILRVANSSQSWANVVLDIPVPPNCNIDSAATAIMDGARELCADPKWKTDILTDPEYMGVQNMTIDEVTIRMSMKTNSDQQWAIGRELRRRIGDKLREAGISDTMNSGRVFVPRTQAGGPA